MKVVALKSFFGTIGNVRKGDSLEVADKIGKSWIEAGLVESASSDQTPAKATTSPSAPKAPKGEAVANQKTNPTLADVKAEKAETTVTKSPDLTTTTNVETSPSETVKADENIKTNSTKESK